MPVWLQALEVGLYVAVVIPVLQVVLHVVEGLDIAVVKLSQRLVLQTMVIAVAFFAVP